jgi:Ca-activated chloride channel family protein
MFKISHIFFVLTFFIGLQIQAQSEKLTRILFILDASNSMNAQWDGETRIKIAKELLAKQVDELNDVPNLEIGLRVYGHQSPITPTYQDCSDTKLEVPFGPNNILAIKNKITTIVARGTTPIARSLEAAAGDFPDKTSRNIIILITDGLEACDGDPCVIAQKLHEKGVSVRPFVIGIGIDLAYLSKFECIGSYMDANDKTSFQNVLKTVVAKALNSTTVQVNLNDINGKPTETNVSFNLYKSGSNEILYTFEHTFNQNKLPDTLSIDPKQKYDIEVFTTPVVRKDGIVLKMYQHNTIPVDAPQGYLKAQFSSASRNYPIQMRIMQANASKTLNVQTIDQVDKYIVGTYDVEVLTLPRIYQTVQIKQSSTEIINIDAPGKLNYETTSFIVGQLFYLSNEKAEWIANLNQSATSGEYLLQPGEYKLVYRQKAALSSAYTVEKTFRITSNNTTNIHL